MSKIEVNAIEPQTGTTLTVGASGDTISLPTNVTLKTDTIQNTNSSTLITQTNTTTIILGFSGSTISIASGASQTGFGATGAVNWDTTPKTANFTAVSGNGYFVDTTTTALTVTLPTTPSAGAIVAISDYANNSEINNITVGRNGSNIEGSATNLVISNTGISMTFVYADSTKGWKVTGAGQSSQKNPSNPEYVAATGGTITTSGDYKIHTFTGPGTFTVTNDGNSAGSNTVEYLVVAGGGGGGTTDYSGGGAGGGFRNNFPSPAVAGLPVTATAYPITVGGGTPTNGNPSIFSTITSTGGGSGGSYIPSSFAGSPGGSGGGGASNDGVGGTGNTPPVSPPQGNPGGTGSPAAGSGGGGAGGAGTPGPGSPATGGAGGPGTANSISGSPVTYSAGKAGVGTGPNIPAGGANTGDGGGARSASGGSGIVVIRYKFQ
jgi:hypothetical protein